MESLDYKTPDPRPSTHWRRRYLIGVPVVAVCHFIGSVGWFFYALDTMDDPPNAVVDGLFYAYQFPMWFICGHIGVSPFEFGKPNSIPFLVINAAFWGACGIGTWHAVWAICPMRAFFDKLFPLWEWPPWKSDNWKD
jgi:hypothetical protein